MAFNSRNMASPAAQERLRTAESQSVMDQGLRAYMLRVYNYMTGGLALTGLVAYLISKSPETVQALHSGGIGILVALAPLGFILALSFGINRMKPATAQILFWAFAGVMGLSLSYIFIAYTGASVARTFFITAAAFAGLSLWGYTTKRSLSGMGTFLFMGLIGLIIAMVVNIFLASSMLQFVISAGGVLIFAGLTAYDTQRIKLMYYEGDMAGVAEKKAIMGATTLYLDFINMFLFLLQFLGNRE